MHILDNRLLKKLGFLELPWSYMTTDISQVVDICHDPVTKNDLDQLDIQMDGIVVKIADQDQRELLGSTAHHPRWAFAYKFDTQNSKSKLIDIQWQVGRTGILTPVGIIEPIRLSGATIQKVTLHNIEFISSRDIRVGDYVMIQRSGEVIPYVVGVDYAARDSDVNKYIMPEHCPICKSSLISESSQTTDSYNLYCISDSCPATLKGRILHRASRDAMDIGGLGEAIVDMLVDTSIVTDVSDLYTILDHPNTRLSIKNLPTMGNKKLDIISQGLTKSKNLPLHRIIYALGIRQVGLKTAKILEDKIYEYISNQRNI